MLSHFEKNKTLLKWILASALAGFVIFLIVDSFTSKHLSSALDSFLNWMEDNLVLGSFAFAGVYIVCIVLFVPGSALTLGAGFIYGSATKSSGYGVALGSVVVFFSASAGACVAFFVGRFVMRDCSQRLFDRFKVMKAIDKALETKGTKLMLLLRLSPLVPFNVLNYVLGVSSVKFKEYATGCLGMIPGTIAFVYIGTTISEIGDSSGSDSSGTVRVVVYCLGGVATFVAALAISYYARQILNRTLDDVREEVGDDDEEEEDEEEEGGDGSMSSELTSSLTTARKEKRNGQLL